MAKDSAFLKKVYDKYLDEDFAYGVSNLNPKREISKGSIDDAKTIEQQVIEEIEKQFAEIKKETAKFVTYKKPVEDEGDDFKTESGGMGGTGGPSEMSGEEQLFQSLGGTDELFYIPGIENDEETPLEREIKQYILKLTPYLGIGIKGSGTGTGAGEGDGDSDSNLEGTLDGIGVLQMNCQGLTFKELLKKKKAEKGEADSADDENPAHGEKGHVCDETCPNFGDGTGDGTGGDGGSGSPDAGNSTEDDSDPGQNTAQNDAAAEADEALLLECALQQCAILQVILIMVRVMSTLKKALAMVLSIVVPIVKIVARAASCWVDPPAAAEVVQLVAEKVAAIIIGLIGQLLQMIWDALKLDCLTSISQSILNQINQILAGINNLTSVTKQISMMASGAVKEMDNALEAIKAAKEKKVAFEDMKKSLGQSMTDAKDAFNKSFTDGDFVNKILPPGYKDLVSATKAIQMSMKQLGKTAGEVKSLSALSKGISETKAL